jgi:hypothetical protein
MPRTEKQREESRDTLQARFCKAIVEHFGETYLGGQDVVDAGDIVIASAAVLTSYLRAIPIGSREAAVNQVIRHLRSEVLGAGNA